jgi:hypothetical protein
MCVQVQDSSQESHHFIVTVNKVQLTMWKQHHQMLMLAKNVYDTQGCLHYIIYRVVAQ